MQPLRALLVLTSTLIGGGVLLAGGVGLATQVATGPPSIDPSARTALSAAEDLAVGVAGLGVAGAGAWLILVTLACARDLAVGRTVLAAGPRPPTALHRALLRACAPTVSIAVLCVAHPVTAEPGSPDRPEALQGLPLPERPVLATPQGPPPERPARSRPTRVRAVTPGDSLWTISAALLGPQATEAEVDRGWRALYRVNRDRVGPDPDHIVPGTRLRLLAPLHPSRAPSR